MDDDSDSYAEDIPSETYEPTYHRPKDEVVISDDESERDDTYEELANAPQMAVKESESEASIEFQGRRGGVAPAMALWKTCSQVPAQQMSSSSSSDSSSSEEDSEEFYKPAS